MASGTEWGTALGQHLRFWEIFAAQNFEIKSLVGVPSHHPCRRHGGTQPSPMALPFPGLPGTTPTAKSPEAHGHGSVHPHPRGGSSLAGLPPGLSVQRSAAARGAASSDEGSAVPSSNRPDSSARAPRILQMGMEASGHPENPAQH